MDFPRSPNVSSFKLTISWNNTLQGYTEPNESSRGLKVDRKFGLVFSSVLSLFSVLSAVGITFSGNNLAKLVFFFFQVPMIIEITWQEKGREVSCFEGIYSSALYYAFIDHHITMNVNSTLTRWKFFNSIVHLLPTTRFFFQFQGDSRDGFL